MGEFDSIWTKYGLRANPFFTEPLEIDGNPVSIETLVGRISEKKQLVSAIKCGGGTRIIVYGQPGVGKTSLVNYIRHRARGNNFISPLREISIPINADPNRVIVETLVLLYEEVESRNIKINLDLKKQLDYLKPFADLEDFDGEGDSWMSSTTPKLISLFKSLTKELTESGYNPVVIHYNNLDKIKDEEKILRLFQDLREFLQNSQAIFIFIGDDLVHDVISGESRLRQIFRFPAVRVNSLSFEELKAVIRVRTGVLSINPSKEIKILEPEIIKILHDLFNGNIREILNSLSFAFQNKETGNFPKPLKVSQLKEILSKTVQDAYLKNLTGEDIKVLKVIMENGRITPTELSSITKKHPQNISAHYLKRLLIEKTIEVVEVRGRNKYYAVVPQMHWIKLNKTDKDKRKESEEKMETKKKFEDIQTKIDSFK